jgi:hypothetical protein
MTNTRRKRVPCGLTPWTALRSLAEGFASGPRSPSPSRLRQPAALLPTRRGGASSTEERPGEQDPGPCSVLERTKRLPHRRPVCTRRGRAATPRQRGPTVPWGPLPGRAARPLAPPHVEGIRAEKPADGEHRLRAMPRATLALLPARRSTMTTCCVCEPAGAPSLVTRETKPDLTPFCASSTEASTRPALAGIVC